MLADIKKFPYSVSIPYKIGNKQIDLDTICITCMEFYGLPGDKYMTNFTKDSLVFYFKNESDALWFNLQS